MVKHTLWGYKVINKQYKEEFQMSIELTQIAQEELRKVVESKNNLNRSLRIYIAGMG